MSAALAAMREALRHRGPDDEGLELLSISGGIRLGLAQTRLAILDVSATGHQPMADPETGSWIVYNGEVYNHRDLRTRMPGCSFAGSSDTETILKAWVRQGDTVLALLRGMFALALYDARRRRLWLARDRLGVKPLYVCHAGPDTWVFASELRALLASGLCERRLNRSALNAYLAFGAVPAPWTLLNGVHSLLPGETWCFELNAGEEMRPLRNRYWRLPFSPAAREGIARSDAVRQLRGELAEAVGLRMLSDVPVGVFLSGGIDSSAVVAALSKQGHKLRTFSVIFGDSVFDESEHSRRVASQFDTEHAELFLQPCKVLEEFDEALAAYDQPSIDGLNTYFIAQLTRQAGVKVALSGLGGDELFAGYSYFRYLARLERPWSRRFARLASWLLARFQPQGMRARKLAAILAVKDSALAKYAICRQLMFPERRKSILGGNTEPELLPLPAELAAGLREATLGLDVVNAQSLLEMSLYLANMLLRDVDQMSMAHSLEVREPLLDHVLVERVARLPGNMKIAPGQRGPAKGLLVDALAAELPRPTLRRPKMGFVLPWERWLRHELKKRVADTLTNRGALGSAGLNPAGVRNLWDGFLAGQPGIRYTDILALLHLLTWTERHRLNVDFSQCDLEEARETQ